MPEATNRFSRWVAWSWYWVWRVAVTLLMGVLITAMVAEAGRQMSPTLAQKLSKQPALAWMANYQETRRLDLAYVFAIAVFTIASVCWEWILMILLSTDDSHIASGWKVDNYKRFVLIAGTVFICGDCVFFYRSLVQMEWGAAKFSFAALVMTATYVLILAVVSLINVKLRKAAKES